MTWITMMQGPIWSGIEGSVVVFRGFLHKNSCLVRRLRKLNPQMNYVLILLRNLGKSFRMYSLLLAATSCEEVGV